MTNPASNDNSKIEAYVRRLETTLRPTDQNPLNTMSSSQLEVVNASRNENSASYLYQRIDTIAQYIKFCTGIPNDDYLTQLIKQINMHSDEHFLANYLIDNLSSRAWVFHYIDCKDYAYSLAKNISDISIYSDYPFCDDEINFFINILKIKNTAIKNNTLEGLESWLLMFAFRQDEEFEPNQSHHQILREICHHAYENERVHIYSIIIPELMNKQHDEFEYLEDHQGCDKETCCRDFKTDALLSMSFVSAQQNTPSQP